MFLRWLSISLRFAPGKGRAGAGWLSGTARSATKKVMIAMTIETMRAVLYPQRSKIIPPAIGPAIHPNDAPPITKPIHCARRSSGARSVASPVTAGINPAVNAPARPRSTIKTPADGASRNPKKAAMYAARDPRISGRRPNLSASAPMKGADSVLVRANAIALIPRASTPAPNSLNRRANRGKIMT